MRPVVLLRYTATGHVTGIAYLFAHRSWRLPPPGPTYCPRTVVACARRTLSWIAPFRANIYAVRRPAKTGRKELRPQ
jgi:hypothetical protein